MSKKTFLIFHHTTGNVEKIKTLDAEIYEAAEAGTITVVDPKAHTYLDEDLYWEDIPVHQKEDEEEEDLLEEDEQEDEFL